MCEMSGMFPSSLAYNFPLEDSFNEEVTLVGNNKVWAGDSRIDAAAVGIWTGAQDLDAVAGFTAGSIDSPDGLGGVNQRENMRFTQDPTTGADANGMYRDPNVTILPSEVFGISSSGLNLKSDGQNFDAHVTNISCSTDLGREEQFELGRRGQYNRTVTFPIEVTCEIEVTSTSGDMISATEFGILATGNDTCSDANNLTDRTIRIATCEGTRISLGVKNKLASVSYGGGDAGGGNVSATYTYTNFNDFTVLHSGDPHASGTTWWTNREDYLVVN